MSSYINDLNSLYASRVFLKENMNTGPGPFTPGEFDEECDDCENGAPERKCLKCDLAADECTCNNKKVKSQDDIVFAKKEKRSGYDNESDDFSHTGEHPEHQASNMVKQNLYRIAKMAAMLHDIIPADEQIEEWVADKVAKAEDSINSVFGYKDYEAHKHEVESDIEIEEKTEQDLYKSIEDGGTSLIDKIKEIMRNQSREKVEDVVYGMIKMLES